MDKTTSMKVFHKVYGYGKVIKTTDEKVYVDFSGKKRIFDYPNAFDKGYLLTDDTPALAMDDTPAALTMDDIKHHIMMLKINQRYKVGMTSEELYDAVRGVWRAKMSRAREVEYVFGIYNGRIVAVYTPTKWYVSKEAPEEFARLRQELTPKLADRLFFVDMSFEQGLPPDENQKFYLGKTIHNLNINIKSQNPVSYLSPQAYVPPVLPVEKREKILDASTNLSYEKMFEAINEVVGTNYTGWMKACWPNPYPDIPFRLWFIKLAKTKDGILVPAANDCLNTISDDWNEVIYDNQKVSDQDEGYKAYEGYSLIFTKDPYNGPYVFTGVFIEDAEKSNSNHHVLKRIGTRVKLIGKPSDKIEVLDDFRKK